jgi:hypothetical protein
VTFPLIRKPWEPIYQVLSRREAEANNVKGDRKRDKFRRLRDMNVHELSALDEDFNLTVLTDKEAYAVAVLSKEEFKKIFGST